MKKIPANREAWRRDSWRTFPVNQQPAYHDASEVDEVLRDIGLSEGLVDISSIRCLQASLERLYSSNNSMLIHAGDCAETFISCIDARITRDTNFISSLPFSVRVGRMCGQFAKPRSNDLEHHSQLGAIPVFRGDIINCLDPRDREPCPFRMKKALEVSRAMYDTVRSQSSDVYISHECLLLPYEESLVRDCSSSGNPFLSSAHFVWIGDRTRAPGGAHIEFCRGIENPIGIKVGPTSDPREIRECIITLDPLNRPGKVTVITRYGAGNVGQHLPALIRELEGLNILYQCDPMHGNTIVVNGSMKTRLVNSIEAEIAEVVSVHKAMGSRLHGLHLEATGSDVTECVGVNVGIDDLAKRYESACDPRLNPTQTRHVVDFMYSLLGDNDEVKLFPCLSPESRLTTADTSRCGSSSSDAES